MAPAGALLSALLLAAPAHGATPRTRIALVPFENVPRITSARATVMETLAALLAKKGYEVVGGEPMEEFLRTRRIRYLDDIAGDRVGELLAELGADACLTGTVLAWDPDEANPEVALAARVQTREGKLLWSAARGLTAAETEGVLGLGRAANVRALSDLVVAGLLESLPANHLEAVRLPPSRRAGERSPPRVFRARQTAGRELKVAILPLQNFSDARDAPRILEALLQHRLSERARITVIGPADLRRAVVASGLRAPSLLSLEQLQALAREVGTSLFLRGAILGWGTSLRGPYPDVELHLTLLDAETGRTVWSGLHRRDGLDYEGFFQRGAVTDPTELASRVVAELLDAFTRP